MRKLVLLPGRIGLLMLLAVGLLLTACGGVNTTDQVTLAAPDTPPPPTPTVEALADDPAATPTGPDTPANAEAESAGEPVIEPLPDDLPSITADGLADLAPLATWPVGFGSAMQLAFSSDGALLARADPAGQAHVLTLADGMTLPLAPVPHGNDGIPSGRSTLGGALDFNADGTRVYAVGAPGVVNSWDLASGDLLPALDIPVLFAGLTGIGISPDGAYVARGGTEGIARDMHGYVQLWSLANGQPVARLAGGAPAGHTGIISVLAFHPAELVMASTGADRTLIIWDMDDEAILRELDSGTREPAGLAFSPDGALLALGDADGGLRVWDVATGEVAYAVESVADAPDAQDQGISALGFVPVADGGPGLLVAARQDGLLIVWEAASGDELARLGTPSEGFTSSIPRGATFSLAIRPDGALLAVGDQHGGTVTLWGVGE